MSKTYTFGPRVCDTILAGDTRLDTKTPQAWIHRSWVNTPDERAAIVVSPHGAFTGAHELSIAQAEVVAEALAQYKRAQKLQGIK